MAGELTLGYTLALNKSGTTLNRNYSKAVDVAGRPVAAGTALVTPAGLELPLDQVTTIGSVLVKHLSEESTANYVSLGESGANHAMKALPGEFAGGRWNLAAVHVLADTGSAWVEYTIVSQ